jgi:uncharacterized membrane protein YdfJ with MMPL/SSD domain
MKTSTTISTAINTVAVSLFAAANAHAASTSHVFVSKLGIVLFLGFCALVLVVQLIPAIMTLYGMLKGVTEKEKSTSSAKVR